MIGKHSAGIDEAGRQSAVRDAAGDHVGIIPPEQFPPCKRQVNESGPCGNALVERLVAESRKHAGTLRFDALTQANRPNHMTIVEMWRSAKDHDAHIVHADTKASVTACQVSRRVAGSRPIRCS